MARGGKREGAGRPLSCEPRQRLVCLIPPFLLAWITRYAKENGLTKTDVVEAALTDFMTRTNNANKTE